MHDPFRDRTPDGADPQFDPARATDTDALDELYDDVLDTEFLEDEGLEAQMRARVRASVEDARTQAPNRMAAAAKAVALLQTDVARSPGRLPPAPPQPTLATTPAGDVAMAGPPPAPPAVTPTAPPPPAAAPPAESLRSTPSPGGGSPERVVPTAGPAAVLSTVYAASAKDPAPSTTPLYELRPPVGADGEARGDNLVIFAERLEHRDRQGRLRQRLPMRDIADVTVQRRLTGSSVVFRSRNGADMVMKGLRPEVAEEMRQVVLAQMAVDSARPWPEDVAPPAPAPQSTAGPSPIPPPPLLPPFDEAELLRKLVDLHRAGVIDERELAAKTDVVAALARAARGGDRPTVTA